MNENAPEIHVLNHKVRLLQAESGFRTSLDSVFVGAACPAREGERILDLGAGVGGGSFCLLWRVAGSHVTGLEIQPSHVELASRNIALNNAEGLGRAFIRKSGKPDPKDFLAQAEQSCAERKKSCRLDHDLTSRRMVKKITAATRKFPAAAI